MHDPKHFQRPEVFDPSRFIKDGQFVRDPRVCVFSVGLRNCVGKKLAQQEFFSFAAHILHKFRVEHVQGKFGKIQNLDKLCKSFSISNGIERKTFCPAEKATWNQRITVAC